MGTGTWSADVNTATRAYTPSFAFSASISRGEVAEKAHQTLDPFGLHLREARDSVDHPNSTPIAVFFDVTGSMGTIPQQLQNKLPQLLGLLTRKNYVSDPQIMFAAIGDATCDYVPFQIGQFESDNRLDENLNNIYLEGNGGGQMTESYELGAYVLARHTSIDSMEKHGRKGYAFIIGDEMAYSKVKPAEVRKVFDVELDEPITVEAIFAEAQEKYNVYFILPRNASHGRDKEVIKFWTDLLGQNVIRVEDMNNIAETIALAVALNEGTSEPDEAIADLVALGTPVTVATSVANTLSGITGS